MKTSILVFCLLSSLPLLAAPSLQQNYLGVYLEINEAQKRELLKDYLGALTRYQVAETFLAGMQRLYPQWETQLVLHRAKDCQEKITALRPLAGRQLADLNNEWTLDPVGQGGWADLDRAQAKVTFMQVLRDNHPELSHAGFDGRIREATKVVDDLVNAAMSSSRSPIDNATVQ